MAKKLENVRVDSISRVNNQAAACFEMDGARFHIWFNMVTGKRDGVLYKNPLLSVERHDPGHFETRSLDATNKANAAIVAALFAEIEERKLVEAALAAEAEKEAKKREELAAAHRLHLKQEAGPAMFDALLTLARAATAANNHQHAGAPVTADMWSELYQATQTAWAELRKAEG
jgi:hypothetical protein